MCVCLYKWSKYKQAQKQFIQVCKTVQCGLCWEVNSQILKICHNQAEKFAKQNCLETDFRFLTSPQQKKNDYFWIVFFCNRIKTGKIRLQNFNLFLTIPLKNEIIIKKTFSNQNWPPTPPKNNTSNTLIKPGMTDTIDIGPLSEFWIYYHYRYRNIKEKQ